MSTKPDSQSPQASSPAVGKTGIGRRRLLRAGVSVAPAMLAVSGRSAMAAPAFNTPDCPKGLSPMAWASVSPDGTTCVLPSHTVGRNALGKSPGYWRPNQNGRTFQAPAWPSPTVVPFSGYDPTLVYTNILWTDGRWATGTTFSSIFGGPETRTFSQILIQDDGGSAGNDNWFLCAAYLNSLVIPNYALTSQEVIDIYNGDLVIENPRGFFNQTWD